MSKLDEFNKSMRQISDIDKKKIEAPLDLKEAGSVASNLMQAVDDKGADPTQINEQQEEINILQQDNAKNRRVEIKAASQIAEPVVDKTVTESFLPGPVKGTVASVEATHLSVEDLTEADLLSSPLIIARPMGLGEDHLKFKILHREYTYRWANRSGRDGSRYSWHVAQGWKNANDKDVEVLNKEYNKDNCIIVNDVILMRLPKLEYLGILKARHERNEQLVSRKNLAEAGASEVQKAASKTGAPADFLAAKVGVYIPPIGQLNSKLT